VQRHILARSAEADLKPDVPRLRAGPLAIFLVLGIAGPAAASEYGATFDFRISGLKAGEITMSGADAAGRYQANTTVDAAGLVGVFADFFYRGAAEGSLLRDGTVVPAAFTAQSRSMRAERATRIDWVGGTPVRVSVEPPRETAPDPSLQAGTLDPVSASFALLRDAAPDAICATSVDVFDGSRRSRISLGAPQDADGELVCEGRYERLEGEGQSFNASSSYGFRVIFAAAEDGMARLERIETRTQFGPATLLRR
jgi:Protein of unknown function (DUF3108)